MDSRQVAGIGSLILFIGLFQPIIGANFLGTSISPHITYIDILYSTFDLSILNTFSNPLVFLDLMAATFSYIFALVFAVAHSSGASKSYSSFVYSKRLAWISFATGFIFPNLFFRDTMGSLTGFASMFGYFSPGMAVYLAGAAGFLMSVLHR